MEHARFASSQDLDLDQIRLRRIRGQMSGGYRAPLLDGESISPADVNWDNQDYTRYDETEEELPQDSCVLMLNDALKNEVHRPPIRPL